MPISLKGEFEMRSSGVLMHISSLEGTYGIGTLGNEAFKFVDFLKKSGQTYWQILPIGPTGYGDSPYQSYSAFAGNPLLIDLDFLIAEELISEDDSDLRLLALKGTFTSYESLFSFKKILLEKAFSQFEKIATEEDITEFMEFCEGQAKWLDDYAMFMALKERFDYLMWTLWEDSYRLRDKAALKAFEKEHESEIRCWKFIQYKFFKQYNAVKEYANKNGIKLYGEKPINISVDSADKRARPQHFMLDEELKPTKVAGCPPDAFSTLGQLWGNPLYDWDAMEKDNYKWWIERVRYSSQLFDLTRIDHFRGFDSFYSIPAGNTDAVIGEWLKGPGMKLFNAIKEELGDVALVAEDLGFLTKSVKKLLADANYPGMNILEFAFGGDNSAYMPHNHKKNSVVYIGTHDNSTVIGWYKALEDSQKDYIKNYLGLKKKADEKKVAKALIRLLFASSSDYAIIQAQDILLLDDSARMNIPSTIGGKNWLWRAPIGAFSDKKAKWLYELTKTYFRLPEKPKEKKKINVKVKAVATKIESSETI